MRKFSYWLCFSLVAVPAALGLLVFLLSLFGVTLPGPPIFFMFSMFGSLIPPMLMQVVPQIVSIALSYALLALVLRRVWLKFVKREGVPHSFEGAPKVLGYVGAWSFILAMMVLILTMLFRAGSGVPAAMLLLPAIFCVPWAIFLTEALSFRGVKRSDV